MQAPTSAIAISAPDRKSATYGEPLDFVSITKSLLRQAGVGRRETVAISLPNGPEAASAFLAVAGACVSAPLNPSYKQDEFEFYLSDLNASLLICGSEDSPAALAAKKLDIPCACVSACEDNPAGVFTLAPAKGSQVADEPASEDHIAMVLHTSGTTSRPRLFH